NALAAAGQHSQAADLYRETIAGTPYDSGLWWRLGNVLHKQGKNEEALHATEEAIRHGPAQGPRVATMHNELGLIHSDMGQRDRPVAPFRKATQLRPDDSIVHENLGDELLRQGRLGDAVEAFREAVRLKPEWSDPRTKLAEALERQGHVDDADAVLAGGGP